MSNNLKLGDLLTDEGKDDIWEVVEINLTKVCLFGYKYNDIEYKVHDSHYLNSMYKVGNINSKVQVND